MFRLDTELRADRRREQRFQVPGAAVTVAGDTVNVINLSTIGIACPRPIVGVNKNEILQIELSLPRRDPTRRPHRFTLLAMAIDNNGRGLILRFIQPSPEWVRAMTNYLAAMGGAIP